MQRFNTKDKGNRVRVPQNQIARTNNNILNFNIKTKKANTLILIQNLKNRRILISPKRISKEDERFQAALKVKILIMIRWMLKVRLKNLSL